MPFVKNGEISIYYQIEGNSDNPVLVLLHWFMGSHQTWYDVGWVRELHKDFYLILIDHRGYGKSSKLYNPEAYKIENHVRDVEIILNNEGIDKAHFMGYSMGGRIAFGIAAFLSERVKSLVIGGMHPYSSDRIPTNLDKRIELLSKGMEITLKTYNIGPQVVFERMMKNDPRALLADTIQTKSWEGIDEKLKNVEIPILLFVGTEDGFYEEIKKISKDLHGIQFVAFTGENHRSAFLKRNLLLPHLRRFLNF